MHKLSAIVLFTAALGAAVANAQTTPAVPPTRTVRAVQPGLLEVMGPRVNEIYGAGIQKISATAGGIAVQSPWGHISFGWPKDVKPVAFTIETAKNGGATISAPGFTEANKADYRAAIEAVVPMAITKAQAQKETKVTR